MGLLAKPAQSRRRWMPLIYQDPECSESTDFCRHLSSSRRR